MFAGILWEVAGKFWIVAGALLGIFLGVHKHFSCSVYVAILMHDLIYA